MFFFRYLWSWSREAIIRGENTPDTAFWDFVPGRGGTRVAVMVDICLTILGHVLKAVGSRHIPTRYPRPCSYTCEPEKWSKETIVFHPQWNSRCSMAPTLRSLKLLLSQTQIPRIATEAWVLIHRASILRKNLVVETLPKSLKSKQIHFKSYFWLCCCYIFHLEDMY